MKLGNTSVTGVAGIFIVSMLSAYGTPSELALDEQPSKVYAQMDAAQMGSLRMRSLTPLLVMRYKSFLGGAGKRPPQEPAPNKALFGSGKRKKKTQSSSPKQKPDESQNWLARMKNVTDAMRQQSRAKSVGNARQKYYSVSGADACKGWSRLPEPGSAHKTDEAVHAIVKNIKNELKTANEIAFASAKKSSKLEEAGAKSESAKLGFKAEKGNKGSSASQTRLSKEMEEWLNKNMSMLEKISGAPNAPLKIKESIFIKKSAEPSVGNPGKSPASTAGSTVSRASSNVFKMSTSGSYAKKDIREINAQISRMRHDKNVEKDSMRFPNETPTGEQKGANELLEIRPRYVETIVDPHKPQNRKKASSSATDLSSPKSNAPARESKSSVYDLKIDPTTKPLCREKTKSGSDASPSAVAGKNGVGVGLKKNDVGLKLNKNDVSVKTNKNVQVDTKGFVLVGETNAAKTFGKNTSNFVLHDNPHVKKAERKKASSSKSETWASSRSAPAQRAQGFGYDLKINPRSVDQNVSGKDNARTSAEGVFNSYSYSRSLEGSRNALSDVRKASNAFDVVSRPSITNKEGKETINSVLATASPKVSPKRKDTPNSAPVTVNNFKPTNRITNIPAAARTDNTNMSAVDQNELKASELKDRLNDRILSHYRLTSIKNDKSVSLHGDKAFQINAGKWGQKNVAPLAPSDCGKSDKTPKSMKEAVLVDSRAVKSPKPIIDMMTGIQSRTLDTFIKDGAHARRGGVLQKQQCATAKPPKVAELKPDVEKAKKRAKKTKQTKWQPLPSRSEPQLSVQPGEVAASSVPRERSAPDCSVQRYGARGSAAMKSGTTSKSCTTSNRMVSGEPSPAPNTVDVSDEELWSKMARNRMSHCEELAKSPGAGSVKSGSSAPIRGSKSPKRTNYSQNLSRSSPAVCRENSAPTFSKATGINSSHRDNTVSPSRTKTEHSPKPVASRRDQELIQSIRDQWGEDLRIKYPNLDKFVGRLRSKNIEQQMTPVNETGYSSDIEEGSSQEKAPKSSRELFRPYDPLTYNLGLNQHYRPGKPNGTTRQVSTAENTSSNAIGDLTPPSTCTSGSNAPEVISSKSSIFSSYEGDHKDAARTRGATTARSQVKDNYKIVPLEEWMRTRENLLVEKMQKTPQKKSSKDRQHKFTSPGKSHVFYTNDDTSSLNAGPVHSDRFVKRYGKKSRERRDQMLKTEDEGSLKPLDARHEMYRDICETYMNVGGRADKSGRGVSPATKKKADVIRSGSSADPRRKDVWSSDRAPQAAARSQSILDVDSVLSQMQLHEAYRSFHEEQDGVAGNRARGENPVCMPPNELFRGLDGTMTMTVNSVEDCKYQPEVKSRPVASHRSTRSKVPSGPPDTEDPSQRAGFTGRTSKPSIGYDGLEHPDNLREILAAKRRQLALEAQKELICRCEDNIRKHESALERYRALLSMAQEEGIDILNGDDTKRR